MCFFDMCVPECICVQKLHAGICEYRKRILEPKEETTLKGLRTVWFQLRSVKVTCGDEIYDS